MKLPEERYLLYKNLESEAPIIFANLIEKLDFRIVDASIYSVHLENNRCKIDIVNESENVQIWLSIKKYSLQEMIPILSMFKGDLVYEEYKQILSKHSKEMLIELSSFFLKHFKKELTPTPTNTSL